MPGFGAMFAAGQSIEGKERRRDHATVSPSRFASSTTWARAIPSVRIACGWSNGRSRPRRFKCLPATSRPRATHEMLIRVHPADYVQAIERASPTEGRIRIDQDTAMSPGSYEAALRAAGGARVRGRRGDDG